MKKKFNNIEEIAIKNNDTKMLVIITSLLVT